MVILRGNISVSEDFIITTPNLTKEPKESVGCTMFAYMKEHAEKVAQVDAKTGHKDTFGEFLRRCVRTALHMSDKGVTSEHTVTLCTNNHLNSAVPYLAAQFLGAKVASLDPSFSQAEMGHLLKQVRPKILFLAPESAPTVARILSDASLDSEMVIFGQTFEEYLKPHPGEAEFRPVKMDIRETAVIHFSSGTTGMPKGICLSHYSVLGQALNISHAENPDFEHMKRQARRVSWFLQLGYTSLYWVSSAALLLTSIVEGFSRLVCEEFDAEDVWNLIDNYRPAVLILTPIQIMDMLKKKPLHVDVNSVLSIIIVGSPISRSYFLKLKEAFPDADLTRGYGQTEVGGVLTNFKGNDVLHRSLMNQEAKIESVGLPVRGMSYKVVDVDSGKNLGPGQCGELRVRSRLAMNGYHDADSADAFDAQGWLKTGDVVRYDEDFCFYVVDRMKEAFKYRGWIISPAALEEELLRHPAVRQAVVVGVPREDGCHPMGVVVVDENLGVGEEDVERFVEGRVSDRQRLRAGVRFVKRLPLTATGKVKRMEVKKMVVEDLKCTRGGSNYCR